MNIAQMLVELRAELENIDQAIFAFERLALGGRKRRGRPPKWMSEMTTTKKRTVSPKARKRMAEAQRKRRAKERTRTHNRQYKK
jgi:hypothetical protein